MRALLEAAGIYAGGAALAEFALAVAFTSVCPPPNNCVDWELALSIAARLLFAALAGLGLARRSDSALDDALAVAVIIVLQAVPIWKYQLAFAFSEGAGEVAVFLSPLVIAVVLVLAAYVGGRLFHTSRASGPEARSTTG